MKPISYEKEVDIVAFLKKQMSSREVTTVIGFSQFKVNRIMKKHFENILMPRGSCPQALTTWEKQYANCLVPVGRLDTIVEATRELKSALGVDD
jgi:hypothetical protein